LDLQVNDWSNKILDEKAELSPISDGSELVCIEKDFLDYRMLTCSIRYPGHISGVVRTMKRDFPSAASLAFIRNDIAAKLGLLWDRVSLGRKGTPFTPREFRQRLFEIDDLDKTVFEVISRMVSLSVKIQKGIHLPKFIVLDNVPFVSLFLDLKLILGERTF
jgi:hypothetical protein